MEIHMKARFASSKGQIEEFARKLAQHQATYPRPPPHRRGKQEEMPKFDAFIKMRDNNMEILRNRIKKDHIMFPDNFFMSPLSLEHRAVMGMMLIMETIGVEIGYPGVQAMMQKNGGWYGFWRFNKRQVQDLLVGTVDIRQLEYELYDLYDGKNRDLMEVLSRESCIGQKAADDVVENVQAFIRDLALWKLVNELERFRSIAQRTPGMSLDFMKDASEEIEHYLDGFDFRMYEWLAAFHSKSDGEVKREIENFATKLAQHRETYPRAPPHRRGQQEEMPKFDAFIRMRDNIMKVLQNRMRKDHIMFHYRYYHSPLFLERKAMMEIMEIVETLGIVFGYPGLQQGGSFVLSLENVQKVQQLLDGTVDITEGTKGLLSLNVLSRESCIGEEAKDKIVANIREFVQCLKSKSLCGQDAD